MVKPQNSLINYFTDLPLYRVPSYFREDSKSLRNKLSAKKKSVKKYEWNIIE